MDLFNDRLAILVSKLNGMVSDGSNSPMKIEAVPGRRYVKLVLRGMGAGGSAYGFIDRSNGDLLKAASWNAPAKGKRSNLFDTDYGMSGCSKYGMRYFR